MHITDICIETITEKFPNVPGIWMFGSIASGTGSANSDIDLAILLEKESNSVELWQCAQEIARRIDKEVDLIDLLNASTVLRAQVMKEGKQIYCADKFKCDLFETEALADYLRFSEERKEIVQDIKSNGKVLGN